ncbi:MAG: DegT/DnrJ/EryC1/StrS family aminotransferase [Armatimonadota bacterium]
MTIPLSRPDITEAECQEVLGVLKTPWLSLGPKVEEFEAAVAASTGRRHAVAVSSGTAALHLAGRALGFSDGVEVITTPFTFAATANILLMERAHPVFVDVDPVTLNLDPQTVTDFIRREYRSASGRLVGRVTGRPLVGILPVDVYGHPVKMDEFRMLADAYGLRFLDDTAEAFGSEYSSGVRQRWVAAGAFADAAVYAFYPNKQITTGEGGMVVTDDDEIAAYTRSARNQGRAEGAEWLCHDRLGFNYRMDELSAALGVAQMKRLPTLAARRVQVAAWYGEVLGGISELTLPAAQPWARVSWFVYVVRVAPGIDRDGLIRHLAGRGITSRAYFPALHLQPYFKAFARYPEGSFPVAEDASRRAIALPFYNDLSRDDIQRIAAGLKEGVQTSVSV